MPRTPRQMHGRRALAAAAAVGLLVSLFAPWYRWTVVAPGVHGLRTLTLTRSGWQAFSATELLSLVVAGLALVIVVGMPSDVPEDGPAGRLRLPGVLVAVLGVIAFVVVLARLTTAPGTTKHALAETMVAIRWGIFLALGCSAALTAAGLRLIRSPQPTAPRADRADRAGAARASRRERVTTRERARVSSSERVPRPPREPETMRTPRQERSSRADRARPTAARTDDVIPSPVAPERRPERTRPTRRADRALWDEPATGWLDLPE